MFPELSALLTNELTTLVLRLADPSPQPEDVKAGWTAFALFLLLLVAVGLLGLSLVRHLRRAQANDRSGMFGRPDGPEESDGPGGPSDAASGNGPEPTTRA